MSRHRNVRGMDYGEDYEGYDDVYGHSVEDDYGVSPSTAEQFIFQRSLQHHQLASFLEEGEEDLKREEEADLARRDSERSLSDPTNFQKPQLSDIEEAQLQSCLEEVRNVVGETVPERTMIEMAVTHHFNFEKTLNALLDQQESSAGNNNNMETQRGVSDLTVEKQGIVGGEFEKKADGLLKMKGQEVVSEDSIRNSALNVNSGSLSDVIKSREVPHQKPSPKVSKLPLADLIEAHHSPKLFPSPAPAKANAGVLPMSSLPLSALANAHLSSPPRGSSIAQGQGSLSLSELAGSHLGETKGTAGGGVLSGRSLSELPQRSLCSTPPRQPPTKGSFPEGGHGLKPVAGISLSDLASANLSANPTEVQSKPFQSLGLGSLQNVPLAAKPSGQGALRLGPRSEPSLSSLASAQLSSNPPGPQQEAINYPPASSLGNTGISLSSLASAHLSSTPQLDLPGTNRSSADGRPHDKSKTDFSKPAGSSLSSLATAHLSQVPGTKSTLGFPSSLTTKPIAVGVQDQAPATVSSKVNQPTSENIPAMSKSDRTAKTSDSLHSTTILTDPEIQLTQASSKGPTFPTGCKHLPLKHSAGFRPVSAEEPLPGIVGSDSKTRVPTPPGFQSRAALMLDRSSPVDLLSPEPHDSTYPLDPTNNNTKPLSKLHKLRARQDKYCLLANPSVFGRALCTEFIDQSKALSDQQGVRIASYVVQRQHSRPTVHRQFLYQRQKSWTTGTADHEDEIIPFDFSSPSPDDIIRQRQAGAFGNTNSKSLGATAQPPKKQPSPGRTKRPLPAAAAAVASADDPAVASIAPEVAKLSMPSKGARKGFVLGPVPLPSEIGDKRRKSAVGKSGLRGDFLDGMTDGNMKSESRGKLPTVMSAPDLTVMAGSSAVLPGALASTRRESKTSKAGTIDISKEYSKRQEGKQLINLVVIGHVDAGKSTLMGHLLYLLGQVNQRQMHKYEQESKKQGKASFAYAWVLDETGEERQRGITMDVGLTNFETPNRTVTLLDAPGHKDFIPNMITGAAQADVAILVVDATRGEFETGFDSGGQTREHALLVRSLGVTQLAVAINKLDTVGWSEERFNEIVGKLGQFLKQAGFKESDVQYIPCSGLTGENLKDKAKEPALTKWYNGPSLVDTIDGLKSPKRPIHKAYRQCVSDVFKGMGAGISIAGKIESGGVQVGDRVVIMPTAEHGQVRGIYIHEEETKWACAGDHATVVVTGIDQGNIGVGSVMCSVDHPIPVASRFRARVIMFNLDVPVTKGFPVLLHYQTVSEPAIICKLISTLHKSTGEVLQKRPKCLTKQSNAIIDIETSRPVCLELYKDFKDLGRFMLRYSGSTIGAGVVTEIKR
ncbi:HBS1-like protein isoform X1 [Patiria miniata]|uniref:Tr-type G domain-containing protein n=1 Tax=Patiria miniata TaxID=46514 RepID=A0A914A1W2_PATMI|nr:HBS1-like protein isoform X1 [Patiria miniata]